MYKIAALPQIILHCGIIQVQNIWILGMKVIVTPGADLGFSQGGHETQQWISEATDLGAEPPQKLQAIGPLKYQSLKFRAHLIDLKDVDKYMYYLSRTCGESNLSDIISCLFVVAPRSYSLLWILNGQNLGFMAHSMNF